MPKKEKEPNANTRTSTGICDFPSMLVSYTPVYQGMMFNESSLHLCFVVELSRMVQNISTNSLFIIRLATLVESYLPQIIKTNGSSRKAT